MAQADVVLAGLFFVVAVVYSSVGHAGASGYLAAMAFVGVSVDVMKPTALVLNILVATIATASFHRAGHFSWRTLWPFALGSIPLAFVGGAVKLPTPIYRRIVGVVLILSAIRLAQSAFQAKHGADEAPGAEPPIGKAVVCGGAIGLLAGLTGTGGGIFLSPLLLLLGWATTKRAAAVSAAFILVNSIAGLGGNLVSVRSIPSAIPLWALAAVAGGGLGSYLGSQRLDGTTLRALLALVLVVAGGKLLLT